MRFNAFVSTADVLREGLSYLGIDCNCKSIANQIEEFSAHYAASPDTLSQQWFDLSTTAIEDAKLKDGENSIHGFHSFLRAHYFLWNYPKNSKVFASRFNICSRRGRGKYVWDWISKIAALKQLKIVWTEDLDSPSTASFIAALDGTDYRVWEKKHPHLNQDPKQMSKKFKHGALKWEIMIHLWRPKIVWINGPYRGGMHDMEVFRTGGLKDKVKPWKKVICDSGYQSSRPDEKFLSTPNSFDSTELAKFKSRARL